MITKEILISEIRDKIVRMVDLITVDKEKIDNFLKYWRVDPRSKLGWVRRNEEELENIKYLDANIEVIEYSGHGDLGDFFRS